MAKTQLILTGYTEKEGTMRFLTKILHMNSGMRLVYPPDQDASHK